MWEPLTRDGDRSTPRLERMKEIEEDAKFRLWDALYAIGHRREDDPRKSVLTRCSRDVIERMMGVDYNPYNNKEDNDDFKYAFQHMLSDYMSGYREMARDADKWREYLMFFLYHYVAPVILVVLLKMLIGSCTGHR